MAANLSNFKFKAIALNFQAQANMNKHLTFSYFIAGSRQLLAGEREV